MSPVEVNEARIFATGAGLDWWLSFRRHMEPAGRITVLTASLGGDRLTVACDSSAHAGWLHDHMIASGVPASAVRRTRSP